MNILLGSHGFPPNQAGGAEWRTFRTARWLSERGHTVEVLAIDEDDWVSDKRVNLTDEQVDGIRVRRLSYHLNQTPGNLAEYDNPVIKDILAKLVRENHVDIFHLICGLRMTGSAIHAARWLKIPIVLTLTDFWFLCPRITLQRATGELCTVPADPSVCTLCLLNTKRRYRLPNVLTKGVTGDLLKRFWHRTNFLGFDQARQIDEWIISRRVYQVNSLALVNKIIAPSNFLAELYKAQGIAGDLVRIIRQGVNFDQQARKNRIYRHNNPIVFGYVGQLADHKGVDILVKAFHLLPKEEKDIKLILYGNLDKAWPPYLKLLKREMTGDPRITFGGHFDNSEARKIYEGLDILVMPSIWYENSPNVILEAFAYGTPVITTNIGGMAELVKDGQNGLLFERGNTNDLVKKLQLIVENPSLLDHLNKGIPSVRTLEEEMLELEKIYTTLVYDIAM